MISKIKEKAKDWLLWSQKYTRTDMVYLAKGGFWLTLGDIIASGMSFVMAIAFAHFISKDVFGTYKYILSITGILGIFSLSGLGTALKRSIAQGKEGSLMPTFKMSIRWAMLGSIGGLGVSFYYFFYQNSVLGWAFLLVATLLPFKDNFSLYQSVIEGKKLFKTGVKYSLITNIVSSSILILTVILSKNLFLILGAYFIPRMLITFFFFLKTLRRIPKDAQKDPDVATYGKHLSALGILGMIAERLDTILLWNLLGASSVAIYSFALAPAGQIRGFLGIISILAFPKLAQSTKEELKKTLLKKLAIMSLIIAIITLTYILAAPFLFKILFPKYLDSVMYSQVFALSMLFIPRNILGDAMAAHGEKNKLYILSLTGGVIKITLMFIFIKMFGIWGAIYSYLITGTLSLVLATYLFKRS